jgi:EpsD family peptidyl-prolyl cis-trans isomerase
MQPRQLASRFLKPVLLASLTSATLVLVACGGGKDDKKASGQTVARVNKEELTVHQINFLLSQQRGLRPDQTEAVSRQMLERLIDQELAIQKAGEQKLDRDVRVVAQLEAARREIISRAYFERVGEAAPKPSTEDIKKYYDENPALFAERRVYQLQEIAVEATSDKIAGLGEVLKSAKNANDFVQYLRSNGYKFTGNQVVRGAEQIPLNLLSSLSKLKDGESIFNATAAGANVLVLVNSKAQPVDEKTARPAIEQFLVNERKRRLVADDLKSLRAGADIKYLGKFAEAQKDGSGAPTPGPSAADVAASAVQAGSVGKEAAPAAAAASGGFDASTISKGLGLK